MRRSLKNSLKRNTKRDWVNYYSEARAVAAAQVKVPYERIMVAGTYGEAVGEAAPVVRLEDAATGQVVEHRLHRFPPTSWEVCPTPSQLRSFPMRVRLTEDDRVIIEKVTSAGVARRVVRVEVDADMAILRGCPALPVETLRRVNRERLMLHLVRQQEL